MDERAAVEHNPVWEWQLTRHADRPLTAHGAEQDAPSTGLLWVAEPLNRGREPCDAVGHGARPFR
jgi:hypothetical protein